MTLVHHDVEYDDPVYVHSHGANNMGPEVTGVLLASPTSGTLAANRIFFVPYFLNKPYLLSRWWWANGATVGTDVMSVGLFDQDFRIIAAGPQLMTAGTNALQYANPGIAHAARLTMTASNADQSSYDTASVTMKAGLLYLMTVMNGTTVPDGTVVNSITATGGGAPTFTSRSTTQFNGTALRVSVWSVVPSSDYAGTLTIDFNGVTQAGCIHALHAVYNVDTATNDGVVQQATGTGNDTTPTATLSAFGSSENGTFLGTGAVGSSGGTPSAGYIEMSDQNSNFGGGAGIAAGYSYFTSVNDTTPDHTLGGAQQWGACALEIKSKGASPFWVPSGRGYMALEASGAVTTVFQSGGSNPGGTLTQSTQPGFPHQATPAGGIFTLPMFGFTRRSTP